MKILSDYIKKEFGIIPDEAQIEEIKKIVIDNLNSKVAHVYNKYGKIKIKE